MFFCVCVIYWRCILRCKGRLINFHDDVDDEPKIAFPILATLKINITSDWIFLQVRCSSSHPAITIIALHTNNFVNSNNRFILLFAVLSLDTCLDMYFPVQYISSSYGST